MKKTRTKQLKLSAQTVRQLSSTALDAVNGGNYTGACAQMTNKCPSNRTFTH